MDYDPDEDWSPANWLGSYAYGLYNDYLNYWELQNPKENSDLTDQHRAQFARLKRIADALTACLHSLAVSPDVVARPPCQYE